MIIMIILMYGKAAFSWNTATETFLLHNSILLEA